MSLLSQLSRRFSRRPHRSAVSRRRAQRSQPAAPAEVLEERTLLSVVFDPGPLAAPITNRADVPISMTQFNRENTETALVINPTDPAQLAIADQGRLAVSSDAGASFTIRPSMFDRNPISNLLGLTPYPIGQGDPDLVFDASGRLFYTNLAQKPAGAMPQDVTVAIAEINPDTGLQQTGTATQFIQLDPNLTTPSNGTSYDKQTLAADTTLGSPFFGRLYVAYVELNNPRRIYLSVSLDGGASWDVDAMGNPIVDDMGDPIYPLQISDDADVKPWNPQVFVLNDGTVGVTYHTDPDFASALGGAPSGGGTPTGATGRTVMRLSTDGGMSFGSPTEAFTAGQSDVYDNRQDFSAVNTPNFAVLPTSRAWFLGTTGPVTRGNPSDADTIYVVSSDDPDGYGTGDFSDIVFSRTNDRGASWTRTTISTGVGNSTEVMPMFDVDPISGTLVVAWYSDQRGIPDPNSGDLLLDVFATYSTDGGLTWAPEFMVNDPNNPFTSAITPGTSRVRFFGIDNDSDNSVVDSMGNLINVDSMGNPNDEDGDETYRMGEYQDLAVYGNTVHIVWNGNTFDGSGKATGQQAWYQSFSIGGTLDINGQQGITDDIVLRTLPGNSDFMEVVVNNQREYVGLWEGIQSIEINGGGEVFGQVGADTITIEDLPAGILVTVNAGPGPNTITIGDGDLDSIQGAISVNGDENHDTLVIDDSANATSATYTIHSGSVTRSGLSPFAFTYSGVESLEVEGGASANIFEVNGTPSGLSLTVTGGPSNDVFEVGNGDIDSNIGGDVSIVGGGNSDAGDALILDDQIDNIGNDAYVFDDNDSFEHAFQKSDYDGELTYAGVERVRLDANDFDNSVHVRFTDLFGNTALTISTGGGENTVYAGNGDFDNNINGDLTVIGDLDALPDRLVILDQDDTGDDDYTFDGPTDTTGATFDKNGYNAVTSYTFLESVVLEANDFDNTVHLNGTGTDTAVTLHMHQGDDEIHVGDGVLEDLGGPVAVDGGAGIDDITLHDETDAGNDTYHVGNNFAIKSGFSLSYENAESFTLNANPDQNTINVESVLATTPMWINAGDSSDTIHLAPTAQQLSFIHAAVHVNGQGGVDNVFLHDELSNPLDPLPFAITDDQVVRPIPPFIVPRFELNYEELERLVLQLGAADDLVDVQSTAPGMHVVVESGFGEDTVLGDVPTPATLTFDGGADDDTVQLVGTAAAEEVSVSVGFGVADVNLISFEDASIDLAGGTDVLVYQGAPGVKEQVEVQSSTTAHHGALLIVAEDLEGEALDLDLMFQNIEILDLLANAGETDTAAFIGTDQDDRFEIDLSAAGTNDDPVLQLFEPDGIVPLLSLRDYRNFDTLQVRGEDGADEFNVYTAPAGPGTGRNLFIDGGSPSGPGNPKDELNVYKEFQQPPPPPNQGPNPGNKPNGTIDVLYELFEFHINFSDIEHTQVQSANAAP